MSIGIEHPDIKFEIVYGISRNKRAWYDNSNAFRLGYRPQDDSEIFAQEVLQKEKPPTDDIAEIHQGGFFSLLPLKKILLGPDYGHSGGQP